MLYLFIFYRWGIQMQYMIGDTIKIEGIDGRFVICDIGRVAYFDPMENPYGSEFVSVDKITTEKHISQQLFLSPSDEYPEGAIYYPKEKYLIRGHSYVGYVYDNAFIKIGKKEVDPNQVVFNIPDKYQPGKMIALDWEPKPTTFVIKNANYVAYMDISRKEKEFGRTRVGLDNLPKAEDITLRLTVQWLNYDYFNAFYYPEKKLFVSVGNSSLSDPELSWVKEDLKEVGVKYKTEEYDMYGELLATPRVTVETNRA